MVKLMDENLTPQEQHTLYELLANNVPRDDENLKRRLHDALLARTVSRAEISVRKLSFKQGHPSFGSAGLMTAKLNYLLHPAYIDVEKVMSLVESFKNI